MTTAASCRIESEGGEGRPREYPGWDVQRSEFREFALSAGLLPLGGAFGNPLRLAHLVGEGSNARCAEHRLFSHGTLGNGRKSLGGVDSVQARYGSRGHSRPVSGGPARSFREASLLASAGSTNAQPAEFGFRGPGQRIAVGLVVLQHVPGDGDHLACGRHHRHIAVFLVGQPAEEHTQRSGMRGQMLRRLHQHPARMARSLLGDAAVVAVLARLPGGRNQSQVTGGLIGAGKARDIAQCRQQGFGHRKVYAGNAHQQFHGWVLISLLRDLIGKLLQFGFHLHQQSQLTVQRLLALGIKGECGQPLEVSRAEQIALRCFDEAMVQDGMDAILDAGAVGDEHGAVSSLAAQELGVGIGKPDAGQEARAQQLREHECIDAIGFDFGFGDGAGAHGIGDDDFLYERLEDANHGPGIGGGFDGEQVLLGQMAAGEAFQRRSGGGEAFAVDQVAGVVQDGGFHDFLVEIESGKWHTGFTPSGRAGWWSWCRDPPPGEPGSRSMATGEEKSGAERHLSIRALGSTGWTGGAATYDSGLMAHTYNRPAPRCSALLSLLVPRSSHLVPSPVSNSRSYLAVSPQSLLRRQPNDPQHNHARYDNEGHIASVRYPAATGGGGERYTYGFDYMRRPKTLTEESTQLGVVTNVSYGPAGEMLTMTGMVNETRSYNSRLQLASYNGTTYSYGSNNNGRIVSETNTVSGETVTYQYDELNRLLKAETVATGGWGQQFTYDGFGNLTSKSGTANHAPAPVLSVYVNRANNRVGIYSYDGNGNQLTTEWQDLSYDYENRMVSASNRDLTGQAYGYDPDNRRVYSGNWTFDVGTMKYSYSGEMVYFWGVTGQRMGAYWLALNAGTPPYAPSVVLTPGGERLYFGGKLLKRDGVWVSEDRLGSVGSTTRMGRLGERIRVGLLRMIVRRVGWIMR